MYKTAVTVSISDAEVEHEDQDGFFWHINYPIVGEEGRFVEIATTRPETLLGDTAVAVNPDDERYKDLIGKMLKLPMVVGVGIGGTFDKAALLAKKALMRPVDSENEDPYYADLEKEMLEKINQLGIGPQGFGGKTTAIGLNIETMPTHIAGMPCAINISCHVTRHKTEVI